MSHEIAPLSKRYINACNRSRAMFERTISHGTSKEILSAVKDFIAELKMNRTKTFRMEAFYSTPARRKVCFTCFSRIDGATILRLQGSKMLVAITFGTLALKSEHKPMEEGNKLFPGSAVNRGESCSNEYFRQLIKLVFKKRVNFDKINDNLPKEDTSPDTDDFPLSGRKTDFIFEISVLDADYAIS